MARGVFILLDENSEDCATKRRMRHLAIAILVLAASGWIAVPIADTRDSGDYSAVGHNRVSLEFSVSTKRKGTLLSSGLVLAGAAESEDTYRVLGLAEAIVLEIPFKDLTTLLVLKDGAASTQNLDMDAQYRAWVGDSDHPRMLEYPVAQGIFQTMKGIADTGFIVAAGSREDTYHRWAVDLARRLTGPLLTCEAVLAEAAYHLGSSAYVLSLVEDTSCCRWRLIFPKTFLS
jgi:hypothetical protein